MKSEILELHKRMIDAHLEKNVAPLVQDLADDFVFVSRGEIGRPTADELRSWLSSYLHNTTFAEYRDLQEPIVGFSRDGSLAWSIVQVKVVGRRTMEDGSERDLDFVCAWITLYERHGDKWLRLAEVSSFNQ